MEDDNSNDVEVVESGTESEHSNRSRFDKPLLRLIKRLINSQDNKQNTVLTNSQIVGILQTEFDIAISNLHELEVDIYLSVMKKFLKDWPKWDEFDSIISSSKSKEDYKLLDAILDQEYLSLKKYLKAMIDYSIPLAKEAMTRVEAKKRNLMTPKEIQDDDIVLEIQCNRVQLNALIYTQPNKQHQSSILNIVDQAPSKITLNSSFTLDTILNWWYVKLQINVPPFLYRREMSHIFQHTLINRKLPGYEKKPIPLDTSVEGKNVLRTTRSVERAAYLKMLKLLMYPLVSKYRSHEETIKNIIDIVRKDLEDLPNSVQVLKPYRKFLNKFAYSRQLCTEVEGDSSNYDLCIDEVVSPRCKYYVGRYASFVNNLNILDDWITVECMFCMKRFTGVQDISKLTTHFSEEHNHEMDLQCTNCKQSFTVPCLAGNRWQHTCTTTSKN